MRSDWDFMGVRGVVELMIMRGLELERERKVEIKGVVFVGSYCSYSKVKVGGEVMFLDMYLGNRFKLFREIVSEIKKDRVFIFSGKYGIVLGSEKGLVYNKYFERREFNEMLKVVVKRFREWKEKFGKVKVIYYIDEDIKRSRWYVDVIVEGCREVGIDCEIRDVIFDVKIDWDVEEYEKWEF